MNPNILPSAMAYIVGQTCSLTLLWQPVKENTDFKPVLELERDRLHQIFPVPNTLHELSPSRLDQIMGYV